MNKKLAEIIFDALTENYKDKVDENKDLKEYLQEKTKNELISLYLSYGFAGNKEDIVEQVDTLKNTKKEESIKSIIEFLNKDFSKIFRVFNKSRFDEIKYIAKQEKILEFKKEEKNKVSFDTIKILKQLGFIFCKREKDVVYFHMPKFIKDKIKNYEKCLYLDLYQDIIEYSIGIADTYGVIHIIDAYDIIKKDIEISFEEYESIVEFFSLLELEPILYSFKRQAICNFNLDDEEIDKILLENTKNEYVVYNKEFYKNIENGKYVSNLLEYKQFRNYLKEVYMFDIDEDELLRGEIIDDYIDMWQVDNNKAKKFIDEALDRYFEIDRLDKALIIRYVDKIKNNMPIWKEGGRINIEEDKIKKVERNEKCPCGSGKKYKNCHGKNV